LRRFDRYPRLCDELRLARRDGVESIGPGAAADDSHLGPPARSRQPRGAPPLGANEFVPPSLLSLFAFPQTFFHNGAALSLDEVMNNVTHRSAGTSGVDTLTNASDRAKVVAFLNSIDAASTPIP